MKYTLRQLEVFLAVSHYENVSKAADELAMSQSACSSALKDFESQFDIQLFDRVGKRLQTNEEGRRLRPKAEALVAQAKDLERDLIQHNQVGRLNIGATLTIGNYLCVKLIDEFIKTYPGAKVGLEVANTRRIAEEILNFDIDLGMIEGEFQHSDLDVIPWLEDELICFCSPQHRLAKIGHISKEDFLAEQWILREAGSGTRQTFDRAVSGLLSQLDITLELQHTEAIKRAVEANIGISCLSEISLKDAFTRGDLIPLSCDLDLKRHFYLVIHQQKYRSTGIQRWLELCEKQQSLATYT